MTIMPPKPLFSLTSHTVSERIAKIKSKVDPAILKERTDFERLMIEGRDVTYQQNETLAEAADEIREKLIEVHEQTVETNGKVKDHESRIKTNETILKGYQKSAANRTKLMTTCIPFAVVGLEIAAKKLGLL